MISSICPPSSSPVPRMMARLMLSEGMLTALAAVMAVRRRALVSGSPPLRAAMLISLMRRVNTFPRLASVAAFLCLMVAHLECPDMQSILRCPTQADIHDGRGHNGTPVAGMPELQVHPAAQVRRFEHGPAPVRAADADQHGFRAKLGMTANPRRSVAADHQRVRTVLRHHIQRGLIGKVLQVHAALDLATDDVAVNLIA